MPPKTRTRRRVKKSIPNGKAYIQSTFNNTLITLTDNRGNVIAWGSAGSSGFTGSRKSTAFAAQRAAENVAQNSQTLNVIFNAARSYSFLDTLTAPGDIRLLLF